MKEKMGKMVLMATPSPCRCQSNEPKRVAEALLVKASSRAHASPVDQPSPDWRTAASPQANCAQNLLQMED